jgi:hypothetical protein
MRGDAQLRYQSSVHETLIGPRVNENTDRFRLVAPQQDGLERGVSKGRRKMIYMAYQCTTSVLMPTDESTDEPGQVDT